MAHVPDVPVQRRNPLSRLILNWRSANNNFYDETYEKNVMHLINNNHTIVTRVGVLIIFDKLQFLFYIFFICTRMSIQDTDNCTLGLG